MASERASEAAYQFWQLLGKCGSKEALTTRAAEIIDRAIAEAVAAELSKLVTKLRQDVADEEYSLDASNYAWDFSCHILGILDGKGAEPCK